MNQGVVQSSTVQQIVAGAGGPTWWSLTNMSPPINSHHHHHQNHHSNLWNESQLLLAGGLVGEEDKLGLSNMQAKKLENWEHEFLNQTSLINGCDHVDIKPSNFWSHHQMVSASLSPKSCITSLSSNSMLDFSPKSSEIGKHPHQDPSSECNSTSATGGPAKKPRTQPSSAQSTFKVRKEKLGDRITALHQIVSPFGKTDTASVLLEAIGYIKFLQNQIEALSQPYLGSGSSGTIKQQHHVLAERNCIFPEDPGQDGDEDQAKDLRSRGLCLVPISSTLHVGNDNIGADYWAPAFGANFQ